MWCRWDAHCGMLVRYSLYKPFTWHRTDARLRHVCYLFHLWALSVASPRRPTEASYFYSLIALFMFYMNNLLTCIMDFILWLMLWSWNISEHDYHSLYYTCVHNLCECIQKYSLACPWLLSWPDFLHGEERCDDSPGAYAKMIANSRR